MKLNCVVCEHEWSSNQNNLRDTSQQVEWKCFIQSCPLPNTWMEMKPTLPWALYILCWSTVTMNEASDHEWSSNQNNFRNTSQQDEWQWQPFTPPSNTYWLWLYIILTLSSESSSCAPSFSSSIWALSRAISSLQWALKSCSCFFRFSFIATRDRKFCRTLC